MKLRNRAACTAPWPRASSVYTWLLRTVNITIGTPFSFTGGDTSCRRAGDNRKGWRCLSAKWSASARCADCRCARTGCARWRRSSRARVPSPRKRSHALAALLRIRINVCVCPRVALSLWCDLEYLRRRNCSKPCVAWPSAARCRRRRSTNLRTRPGKRVVLLGKRERERERERGSSSRKMSASRVRPHCVCRFARADAGARGGRGRGARGVGVCCGRRVF